MNITDDFLSDVLSILPASVPADEEAIIQDAGLREQLLIDFDYEDTETIHHH